MSADGIDMTCSESRGSLEKWRYALDKRGMRVWEGSKGNG